MPNTMTSTSMANKLVLMLYVTFVAMLCLLYLCECKQNPLQKTRINDKFRRKFLTLHKTLDCHERSYTFKAVQTDPETGLQCRDYIRLMSCWGRCNSGEISDYRFPYKRSFHNVCMHNDFEKRLFELNDCDAGAPKYLRYYETVVAKSCTCRQCETSQTNCESETMDYNYNYI